jgi:serine protease AprX
MATSRPMRLIVRYHPCRQSGLDPTFLFRTIGGQPSDRNDSRRSKLTEREFVVSKGTSKVAGQPPHTPTLRAGFLTRSPLRRPLALMGLVALASSFAVAASSPARPNRVARGGLAGGDTVVDPSDTAIGSSRAGTAVFRQTTGATALNSEGITGRGINVAVLDTGIADLPDFAGRLVGGIDLSGEGKPFQDDYGHGTFVAGLIAGSGHSTGGTYSGEAPGAGLVSIKVAGANGVTRSSTVIEGIHWAIAHRTALNIGVLNISMGTPATGSSTTNPLDRAVEEAWQSGIVVVVSAGNTGPSRATITSPGDDPLVITVGATDDNGTATAADDSTLAFSSAGPTAYGGMSKPDLVTSGRSVVSLRTPGSTVDTSHPTARIGAGNFVGSGTSFSAAITSGAAALVLQANGGRPDDVKGRLLDSTHPAPSADANVDGHGSLNAAAAVALPDAALRSSPVDMAATSHTPRAHRSNPTTPTGSSWNGSSWNGSSWNGSSWNGSSWNGSSWNGSSWNGSAWN